MLDYEDIKCIDIIPNLIKLISMTHCIEDKDAKAELMFLFDDTHEELQSSTKCDFNFDVLYMRTGEHSHKIGIKIFDINSNILEQSDEAIMMAFMMATLFKDNANTMLKLISVKSLMPELTAFESCYLLKDTTRLDDFWKKLIKATRNIFMGDEEYNFMTESTKIHQELHDTIISTSKSA